MNENLNQTMQEELHIGENFSIGETEIVVSNDIVVERIEPNLHAVTVTIFTNNLTIDVNKVRGNIHLTHSPRL